MADKQSTTSKLIDLYRKSFREGEPVEEEIDGVKVTISALDGDMQLVVKAAKKIIDEK